MRRFFIASVITGIAAIGAASMPVMAQAPNWQSYGSDIGFSIDFPGAPSRTDNAADGAPTSRLVFATSDRSAVFIAERSDVSNLADAPTSEQVVHGIADGAVGECTTVISQSPFAVPGGAGREAMASGCGGKSVMRLKVYAVGSFSYAVLGLTQSQDALSTGDYAKFFDSFRILGK